MFALLATAAPDGPPNAMALSMTSRIHVTLVNCDFNKGKPSGIRYVVFDDRSRREFTAQDLPAQSAWTTRDWNIDLPEGFYELIVSAGEVCKDDVLLPVLSGQNQELALIGKPLILLRGGVHAMVAGTVPLRGYTARILFDPATVRNAIPNVLLDYPAVVSGNAFYATGLPEGTATLQVANSNGFWATSLQFHIGAVTRSGLIVHITPQELAAEAAKPTPVVFPHLPAQSPSRPEATPPERVHKFRP